MICDICWMPCELLVLSSSWFNMRYCYIPFDNVLSLQSWVFSFCGEKKKFYTKISAEQNVTVAMSKLIPRFAMLYGCKYPISK